MKQFYLQHLRVTNFRALKKYLLITLFFFAIGFTANAQCPPNIDFEFGDFTGWQCWIGTHYILPSGRDTIDVGTIPVPPDPLRHIMLSNPPGNGNDPYGNFPTNCPNGSRHSIQLGNTTTTSGTSRAQGVSYTFTIPPGQDKFSLVYHYAVVFLESVSPVHSAQQQASLAIEVKNLTDNILLNCSSFSFHATSGVPGFFNSPSNPNVKCKDWAAASINLDGNAGKTIQLFFKTATCTPSGHWGYAYVDVNTECSSSFVGATFCPDDTAVTITGPYGYQSYKWFNNNYTQVLGTLQTITLNPPPLSGDSVFVEVTPYSGYGCLDTLTAHLWDTLTVYAYAGRDTTICTNSPVQLGAPPRPGLVYSWSPSTGLSDPTIANPVANVLVSTMYVLSVRHNGGGCLTLDTVNVNLKLLNDSLQLIGSSSFCTASGLSAILKVFPADSIQWFRNGIAIPGATSTTYNVTQTGAYYAMIFSLVGAACNTTTRTQQIDIYESPIAGFTVNTPIQCFKNNQFIFTNTSTISAGALQYFWNLGDGNTATTKDVTHSYLQPGTYIVKMVVTAIGACADSMSFSVTVNPSPVVGFTTNTANQCFKNNQFVFTNSSTIFSGNMLYTWDMGNGTQFFSRDVTYSYPLPGTYTVKLVISGVSGGCKDSSSFDVNVYPSPVAGFVINQVNQCYPNHQFIFTNTTTVYSGTLQYNWDLGDGNTATTKDVTYSYAQPGVYLVKMLVTETTGGCADSSSFTVTVYPFAMPEFTVKPICVNLRVPIFNQTKDLSGTTINYLWDFGNGTTSTDRIPYQIYSVAGTYLIKLSVSTAQCPLAFVTKQLLVNIEAQQPGTSYPVINTISFFREQLQARPIGNSVLWIPGTSLDNRISYKPIFYGPSDQLYTIQLRTPNGCLTVDTQFVKTRKNIKIYVPNIFTPGNKDGKNDLLRPLLMSFVKVNYFRVYDRWGKLLFEMKSDRPGWDGRFGGQEVSLQTVVWTIEAVDIDGVVHREQGTTILMR